MSGEYGHTADGVSISLVDFPALGDPPRGRAPVPLTVAGARQDVDGLVFLPKAPGGTGLRADNPVPSWDLYTLVRDTSQPPVGNASYYISPRVATYAFSGALGQASGQIDETIDWVASRIPIADLFRVKRQEIRAQDQTVRYNAVDTALNANWWLVVTQDMRFELDGIQGNWAQRQIEGKVWPVGTNNPWVGVYNAATTDARRVQVPGADAAAKADTWNTLYTEKTQHDQATGNATTASLDALDVEYDDGNGDWQAVADHDAADPVWGYPPTVNIDPVAAVFFGA